MCKSSMPRHSYGILLCFYGFFHLCYGLAPDVKVLNVGEELERETVPLNNGSRLYQLHGLERSAWYEVKISYPASIPASFSIGLVRDGQGILMAKNRRLLNTEKLVFQADARTKFSGEENVYALVSVVAEGVVAIPSVKERDLVLFNIVCDKLSLGIPIKAWWVGIAAVLCLVLAFIIPDFLPLNLFMGSETSRSSSPALAKES